MKHLVKTSAEIEAMREGAEVLRAAHDAVRGRAVAGVSLFELDRVAEEVILGAGAVPGFKGYRGFPATLCTMVNSQVVHGIPDGTVLEDGDLLSVDCGVIWKGLNTDAAFSVIVGGDAMNVKRAKFSACVREALLAGCEQAVAGNHVGDIGHAISGVVRGGGYSICKEFSGHGVGKKLWEEPSIFNYGNPGTGPKLVAGMTIAIEPIVSSGKPKCKTLADKWTVVTVDGSDACQWEHCGVVGEGGFEVFV